MNIRPLGRVLYINAHPGAYPFSQMLPLTFGTSNFSDDSWDVSLVNAVPTDSGFTFVQREDRSKMRLPDHVSDYCAIIITGSSYACYARKNKKGETYLVSWKRELIDFIKEAGKQQVPIFGVCFGAQMLAEALGGTVRKGEISEIGWSLVRKNANGLHEQLLCDVPTIFFAPENHSDWIVRLPENAVLLAESQLGVQAFRSGIHIGVQFHPERTPGQVRQIVMDAVNKRNSRFIQSIQTLETTDALERFYCPTMPQMFHTFLKYSFSL